MKDFNVRHFFRNFATKIYIYQASKTHNHRFSMDIGRCLHAWCCAAPYTSSTACCCVKDIRVATA